MGGAQSYLRTKMLWLKSQGWEVDIIYAVGENVAIPELREFKHRFPEIQYPTFWYNSLARKRLKKQILSIINASKYDEIIIESTVVYTSTWGEFIAKDLGAKHIIFSLQENNEQSNTSLIDFLKYKYDRNEIAGIGEKSVYEMLKSQIHESDYTVRKLVAYMGSPVEEYEYPLTETLKNKGYDYIIGSICRLNKPIVIPTAKKVLSFAIKYPENRFALVLVGDSPNGDNSRQEIESMFEGVKNIDLYITGYIYPIPLQLIRTFNLAYSTAGSAGVSQRAGIPTISIDAKDLEPIGIVGYTTNNRLFRQEEPIIPFENYLESILLDKEYLLTEPVKMPPIDFKEHFDFIDKSSKQREYYKVETLDWNNNQIKQKAFFRIFNPILIDEIKKVIKN